MHHVLRFTLMTYTLSLEGSPTQADLDSLLQRLDAAARGAGVGQQLLEMAEKTAVSRSCPQVLVDTMSCLHRQNEN